MRYGMGQSVLRKEDDRLLIGAGRFVDDLNPERLCHAQVVYSDYAHADIRAINTAAAAAAPGVLAVLTGDDVAADGLGPVLPRLMPEDMGGPKGHRTERPILAQGRVRHVGDRVAVVIAETIAAARDAAELIDIDYGELPAVIGIPAAVAEGAPLVYDAAPGNVSFTLRFGDADATAAAFSGAAHTVTVPLHHARLAAAPIEPRAAIGTYATGDGLYTLYTSTQAPHILRSELARMVLHVPETAIRVVSGDVGGGFGMKTTPFPEDAIVLWAARKVGRPVKWVSSRSEAMLGDDQGRGQDGTAELAVDGVGKILAYRIHANQDVGAYLVGSGAIPPLLFARLAPSVYRLPQVAISCSAVFTNAPPTTPYRGAGRPEAIYAIERAMDAMARQLAMDPVELRRRNLLSPGELPHTTQTGYVYDSGEFAAVLDQAAATADWAGFPARRDASAANGRRRGRGVCYYVDDAGNLNDRMEIRFDPSGSVTILAGTMATGQGHATTFAQLVADWLGVPFDNIRVLMGDTDRVQFGRGTYATRSMVVGGSALRVAADRIVERAKRLAAAMLETDAADLEYKDGAFHVTGTDRSMALVDVAKASFRPGLPLDDGVGLEAFGGFGGPQPSFPNGCHICEVEVDPDTGFVRLDRFVIVDDMGRVINPMLAAGQVHGGVAQGVGEALYEQMAYAADSGQLLTGAFLDYCVPRADDLPTFDVAFHEVPCKTNPLGVKGAGEGGTVGATPAVVSAVLDALAPLGVTDVPMPATPSRVWQAIQDSR